MENTNLTQRNNEGIKAGVVGIFANFSLFAAKMVIGTLASSHSIVADAINNLSDFLSSLITVIGFRIAAKPADKEHPYGHERFEYISGFIISIIMLYLGLDVIQSSIGGILSPTPLDTSKWTTIVLSLSIVVKLAMSFYYKAKANKIQSEVLLANQKDSLNDVIITSSILLGIFVDNHFGIRLDSYIGVGLSIFIMYSALMMIRDFINDLMGTRPDEETLNIVEEELKACPEILGYHDLLIHNYGKYHTFGSVHVEIDDRLELVKAHDIVDSIERSINEKTKIDFLIHLDPLDMTDPEIKEIQKIIKQVLVENYEGLKFHDLRLIHGRLMFDIVHDEIAKYDEDEIIKNIEDALALAGYTYKLEVRFDLNQLI